MVKIVVGCTLDHVTFIVIGVPVGYGAGVDHNGETVGVVELFVYHPVVGVKFAINNRIASQASNRPAFRIVVFLAVDVSCLVICIIHPAVGFFAGGHRIAFFIVPAFGDDLFLAHLPDPGHKSAFTQHRVSEMVKPGFGDQVS